MTATSTASLSQPTQPDGTALLDIRSLGVQFRLRDSVVRAGTDITLAVRPGELLAVVGESGCGKSVLAHALLGLLPANATVTGTAWLHRPDAPPIDLIGATERQLTRLVRGRLVGLVPQSPATALNPVRTGRRLLQETLRAHGHGRADAGDRAETAATEVGLASADLDLYPHELSGGMAQRLATALALASDPLLLLADEPTSGLERPLVEATLDLLRRRCDAGGTVVLITHDLTAARRVADTVAVMYASRIVEHGPAATVLNRPRHPYAHALLDALPDRAFRPIPGHPPALTDLPTGCVFAPRCHHADPHCRAQPSLRPNGATAVACHHPEAR